MKHIEWDFSMNVWVRSSRVDLGGTKVKINLFRNMVLLHIKLNLTKVANSLPTDTPLTPGCGQKVKPYLFSESSLVADQIKEN